MKKCLNNIDELQNVIIKPVFVGFCVPCLAEAMHGGEYCSKNSYKKVSKCRD